MAGFSKVRVVALVAIAAWALLRPAASSAQVAQAPVLRIVVLEGEDGVNIIERGTAVPTLVEVRDRNDLPVSGASVVFLLGEGGTATLNAGLQQVSLTTNALGQAAVTVNPVASGAVELSVSATFGGETVTAAIVQTNYATAAEAAAAGASAPAAGGGGAAGGATVAAAGGGLGTGTIVGIAGTAVARQWASGRRSDGRGERSTGLRSRSCTMPPPGQTGRTTPTGRATNPSTPGTV